MIDRIATVLATGKQYIVRFIDFNAAPPKVICCGEVESFKGNRICRVGADKKFLLSAVKIEARTRSYTRLQDLFEQMVASKVEDGNVMVRSRTGRTVTNYGKAEAIVERDARARLGEDIRVGVKPEVLALASEVFALLKK